MPPCTLELAYPLPHCLELKLSGDWTVDTPIPPADAVLKELRSGSAVRRLRFDCKTLGNWDSLLLTFLGKIIESCRAEGIEADRDGLPYGVRGLLDLAAAVPERQDTRRRDQPGGFLEETGRHTLNGLADALDLLEFIGEIALALARFPVGKARYRRVDLTGLIQDCGPGALPIVSLISLLVGMILAFVGAVQLRMFGAELFIADLVALGMAREMGAMMTAIIMTGRTGAAYAAQLGSMRVNDEIDALATSGIPPVEFLVVPRILALTLTMPLLCLYADLMGMLGGAMVSAALFDISFTEYFSQVLARLDLADFGVGVAKCAVFGVLVGVAGCLRGLRCGRSSASVGLATTSAVVTGIVFVIVSDAVMTLIITALDL
jgi:phospholipid/cholesterol/gamma-HCH transport system permease protein